MKTEKLFAMFKELVSEYDCMVENDYVNTVQVYTDQGPKSANSFFPEKERVDICDAIRDEALPVLNDEEKKLFLKTIDSDSRQYWNLKPSSEYPSTLSVLVNMPVQYLQQHKIHLFNQILEINTILSMKHKLDAQERLKNRDKYELIDDDGDNPLI